MGIYFVIVGIVQSNGLTAGMFALKNKAAVITKPQAEVKRSPARMLRIGSSRSRSSLNDV